MIVVFIIHPYIKKKKLKKIISENNLLVSFKSAFSKKNMALLSCSFKGNTIIANAVNIYKRNINAKDIKITSWQPLHVDD